MCFREPVFLHISEKKKNTQKYFLRVEDLSSVIMGIGVYLRWF